MKIKTFFLTLLAVSIFASSLSSSAHAAQTTGGVNWLDPLGYQKPAFYPITVPDEASVANKYYVNQQSGSGTICSQVSPCGWSGLSGKPGMTGGPAYIYLQGNARLNLSGTLYGSSGNEIVVKPWPGNTNVITFSNDGSGNISGANTISGSGVHHIVIDGGPDLQFSFTGTGSSQNAYTLNISASNITIARTRIQGGSAQGPALGIATGATGIDNVWWVNNEMFNTPNYYGVYTGGGASCTGGNTSHSNLHFINNIFRQICGRGIQIEPRTSGTNTYIEGNAFHDGFDGLSCGVSISHAIEPASACGGTISGVYVRNNLAFELGGGFLQLDGSNIVADNNTIYRYGKTTPITLGSHAFSPAGTSNSGTLRNNIVLSPVQSGVNAFNRTGYTNTNSLCESGCSVNSTAVNVFISTTQDATYLQPKAGGPAVSAGMNLTSAWSTLWGGTSLDYAASLRVASGSWDIGAYEYGTSTPDTTLPTSPTGLAASATSQSSITVSWTASTDDVGVVRYDIERCQGSGCSNFVQVGTVSNAPFIDSNLTANTEYNYHVRAVDGAGNMSGWGNVVGATTQAPDTTLPSAPASLSASATSSSSVNLTWTASTDNVAVTSYQVERCQGSGCSTFVQVGTPVTNSYSDTTLSASTTYRYQVRATDAAGNNSAYSTIVQATTQAAPPVSANMMAAYNFDENTGTTINDLSGHTNTGTASNVTWTTSGKNGSALTFNGSSSSVSVSDNNTLDIPGSFTLSAWIYPIALSGYRDVILKGNNANNYYLETNGINVSFGFFQDTWHEHNTASANLSTNIWTHIAGVFDDTANTVTVFVNGNQVLQEAETGTPPANTLPLTIGSGFSGENWNGRIDDVRIYNTALTQQEIQADMNTPLVQPAQSQSCNTVNTSNFSDAAYNSYGAPFDAFQMNTNLMDAKCTSADTHTVNLTTGITGDTTRIVYTKGYWYDATTTAWRQYTGTCTGALNGEWCQGSVSATITDPNVSTASSTNPTYLVGMTCSVQGGSWKCGCRDTACSNFSWQIQGAGQ